MSLMNFDDLSRFYKEDKKEYDLENNLVFLKWFYKKIKMGYSSYMSVSSLQAFIDKLDLWYRFKYPERKLIEEEGFIEKEFNDIVNVTSSLDHKQLRYQLSYNELKLLDSYYRSNNGYSIVGRNNVTNEYITFNIYKKHISKDFVTDNEFQLSALSTNGKIKDEDLTTILPKEKKLTLDEMYKILKDNHDYDVSELQRILFIHNTDIELREKIFNFTMKKMIYSKSTTPKRGYKRSLSLIKELNSSIKNLNLVSNDIDKIIEDDYISTRELWICKLFKNIHNHLWCKIYLLLIKRKRK
jgi:hypothetical protein